MSCPQRKGGSEAAGYTPAYSLRVHQSGYAATAPKVGNLLLRYARAELTLARPRPLHGASRRHATGTLSGYAATTPKVGNLLLRCARAELTLARPLPIDGTSSRYASGAFISALNLKTLIQATEFRACVVGALAPYNHGLLLAGTENTEQETVTPCFADSPKR